MEYVKYNTYSDFDEAKKQCRSCSIGLIYDQVVLSEGNKDNPSVVIIGESPGATEIHLKRPFVGKAGKLLRRTLKESGLNRTNTLITNTIPCRPENNKFPKDTELVCRCRNIWLQEELRLLSPKVALLLGNIPLQYTIGLRGITRLRGNIYQKRLRINRHKMILIPTYHPSYVLRKEHMDDGKRIMSQFQEDIRKAAFLVGIL